MTLSSLFPDLKLQEEKTPYRVDDERYTIEYIEREAWLLHHFFIKKRSRKGAPVTFKLDERDLRILKRWRKKM